MLEVWEGTVKPYYDRDGITIYHGDCREILPTLPKVDLVLTDPPYGIGIAANPFRQKFAKSEWDNSPVDGALLQQVIQHGDAAIIWGGNYFALPPHQKFLVWNKCQPESFSSAMCEIAWTNIGGPAKVWVERVTTYAKQHPTQKPEGLFVWCIKMWPGASGTVLDPFMGSGTTLVAARNLGRRAIGIEIEEKYCEIAAKRLQQQLLPMEAEPHA